MGLGLGVVLLVAGLLVSLLRGGDEDGDAGGGGDEGKLDGGLEQSFILLGLGVVCLISVSIFYVCSKRHQAATTSYHVDIDSVV